VPCIRQNEHAHERSGVSPGPDVIRKEVVTFPQWHRPLCSMAVLALLNQRQLVMNFSSIRLRVSVNGTGFGVTISSTASVIGCILLSAFGRFVLR